MKWYELEINDVIKKLNSSKTGLDYSSAKNLLDKNGKNEFDKPKSKPLLLCFFEQLADPMIIILLVAAFISAALAFIQNDSFADVFIILFVVIVNAILGVYQENKAEKSIEALQEMSASKSKVLREGKIQEVYSRDLVAGDIVLLEAGDAVPADGRIIESFSLKIEESALTGESVAVNKLVDVLTCKNSDEEIALGDRKNMAFCGSTVVYGRAKMIVTETGMDTEMGKIAGALQNVIETKTPLQIKMAQLSKILTIIVVVICVLVFALQMIKAGGFGFKYCLDSFMIAVSLAVAAIPEGLPAVVTIALSLGVTKMSKRNAIIRKLTAVETLGCAQIICSDKTGTLTQNKMTVVDSFADSTKTVALIMALCCDAKVSDDESSGEPTELALVEWAKTLIFDSEFLNNNFRRVNELPFDSDRKMMTTFHVFDDAEKKYFPLSSDSSCIQCTKGATDVVLSKCSYILKNNKIEKITDEDIAKINLHNKEMADKALRVLSCAFRLYDACPQFPDSKINEDQLVFVGLSGMIDPIRPEVKAAIEECESAGITPVMITGDHIDTAIAIAQDLGILNEGKRAITGTELNKLSDEDLLDQVFNIAVYARVQPEHKTRIVKAWQDSGHVVAMTGDGVNDSPSIKTADIGVGMGITGTDVTKNVADMVLADDNFASIVHAIEEGRRIYDNILKAIQYLLSSNIGEVVGIFFATLFSFIILRPVHLLWVNLVTDCVPALALSLEDAEPGIMNKKPRSKNAGIFSDSMGVEIIYQGAVISFLIILSYFIGHYFDYGNWGFSTSERGITMAFLTMSFVGCFHSLNMRSRRLSIFKLGNKNHLLFLSIAVSVIITSLICFIPDIANAFQLHHITDIKDYLVSFGLGLAIIPIVEIVKFFKRFF